MSPPPTRVRVRWLPAPPPGAASDGIPTADDWVRLAMGPRFSGRPMRVAGRDVIVKGGRIAPSGSRRHGLRRLLLGVPPPAAREFHHLRWLRARLFHAPEPLFALTVDGRFGPAGQLLATSTLPHVTSLERAWEDPEARACLAAELGAELGRMHALRFLHGDAYGRNLLVGPHPETGGPGIGRRIAFVDAWMGGPTPWRAGTLRPFERDLGCLLCDASRWMEPAHQADVLRAYLGSRAANGRPVRDTVGWLERVRAARRGEVRRLLERRDRLRGEDAPDLEWRVSAADLAAARAPERSNAPPPGVQSQ